MNYTALSDAIQNYTQNYETIFVGNISTFVQQAEERISNTVLFPALRKNVTGVTDIGNKYLSCPNDFLSVLSLAVIDGDSNYEYLLNKDVNFMRAAYPNPNDQGIPQYYGLFGPTVASGAITNELSFILAPTPDANYDVELHYYYYPESIVQGTITASTLDSAGNFDYTDGIYYNVPLTGGSGFGAHATIIVAGNFVDSVTVTAPGSYYVVGDILSAPSSLIGNGTGFTAAVAAISNTTGTSWIGDNYSPVLLYGSLVEAYTFMKGEQDMMAYYEKKYQDALAQLIRLGGALERGDAYRDGQYKGKAAP
jgi:hypothetical protein